MKSLRLAQSQKSKSITIGDDTVYIIEGILDSEVRKDGQYFLIKWESYKNPTWEKELVVPKFFREHFINTGTKKVPLPRVKSSKMIGSTVHHKLVYENDLSLEEWIPLPNFTDLGDTISLSCRTEKDKDKRIHRLSGGTYFNYCDTNLIL